MTYSEFFKIATGRDHPPYPWQEQLATSETCESRLINIPTGLGKTAGVILAWLWNRLKVEDGQKSSWPRRLVYCLPMRTLVEQTEGEAQKWIQNLWVARDSLNLSKAAVEELRWLSGNDDPEKARSPIVLMGGEDLSPEKREWDLYPERPAILIGTQDMLLSRALNRGYGMSRYRWPMHFALLNNDALWIMDEVQLMGAGLASTSQLEGFRSQSALGSRNCRSWWMSATSRPDWLKTVDFPDALFARAPVRLGDEKETGRIKALRTAPKTLKPVPGALDSKSAKGFAVFIANNLSDLGLNLVVVNTVKRARAIHKELTKTLPKEAPEPILLHSQFRPGDRQDVLDQVMCETAKVRQIVVSTQVIEAGVDLSAHTLFTELAPWSSLVQRFGRCNRWLVDSEPHYSKSSIYWLDIDTEKDALPYTFDQLNEARKRLTQIDSAAIANLEQFDSPDADKPRFRHVIRRKDLIELFDTTPDLAGADLDIDRFIRDADDSRVQVFWRNWNGGPEMAPNDNVNSESVAEGAPLLPELCSTSIGNLRSLLGKQGIAWRFNPLDREWQRVRPDSIYPGQTYLLHGTQGGYLPTQGWTGDSRNKVTSQSKSYNTSATGLADANEADPASEQDQWQTVAEHTNAVCSTLEQLLRDFADDLPEVPAGLGASLPEILRQAARWHDWGKAHPAFQAKVKTDRLVETGSNEPIAKAPSEAWQKGRLPKRPKIDDLRRKHFRHELASALGILLADSHFPLAEGTARDLAAYLISAHHGKVRLSIRSLPDEWLPHMTDERPSESRFARGVWDDDVLPSVDLGGDILAQGVKLSLEPMELGLCEHPPFEGQPSWAERTLTLRDTIGPFALALLETLLRAADGRASQVAPGSMIIEEAASPYGKANALSEDETAMAQAIAADGLAIQDRFRPEPLFKESGNGHYESRTVADIQKAKQAMKGAR